MESLKDNLNIITDERLTEIANFMLAKAEKALNTQERYQSAFSFIIALSSYPDHIFDFNTKTRKPK